MAITECEECTRFRALRFKPHVTSVVCNGALTAPATEGGAVRRSEAVGPADPETPIADIMSKDVVCARLDMDVEQVRELLVERGLGGVPIVDDRGKPIGIVSRADVLRVADDGPSASEMESVAVRKDSDDEGLVAGFNLHASPRVTAGEIMSPVVLALHESANVGQAASLMAFEGVDRLPIISDDGEVVGILSALDVLRWFGRRSGYIIPRRGAPGSAQGRNAM